MADINALISDARNYATSSFQSARAELSGASATLSGMNAALNVPEPEIPNPAEPKPFVPAIPPQLRLSQLDTSGFPQDLEAATPIPDILTGVGDAPTFSTALPDVNLNVPTPGQLAAFSATLPTVDLSIDFPEAPNLITPVLGTIGEREMPVSPEIRLPVFDATSPDDLPPPDADYVEKFNASYRESAPAMFAAVDGQMDTLLAKYNPRYAEQMAALENRLAAYIDGGSALSPAIENAIYERTRDKTNAEYQRVHEAAYADAAKRGFTLPTGALTSAVRLARQAGADNNSRAAIDIAVKQAELEQQNIQFAVTTSSQLRSTMLSAALSYHQNLITINGQALDAAKTILNAMIEVYNTLVKGYGVKLEAYKAEATVYETRLRSAMAGIELYKAEVVALESLTRIDIAKVERYKAEIDAMNSLASVYRTQIEGVVSRAGLERLKIDVFGAQVQAYNAQTQAKSSEWQGYTAAINGQEAKVKVYSEQVQAYTAQVQAYRAKVEAKSEQVRAISATNQAQASIYAARVQGYSAKVTAGAQKGTAEIEFQRQQLAEYSVASQAAISYAQMNSEYYRIQTQISMERDRLTTTKLIEEARLSLERARAISANSISAANVYGNLAASAMSGMNTLVTQSGTS